MNPKMADKDSDQWEQIKQWVGSANSKPKHPLVQEAHRLQMRQPQHLAPGGMVDGLSDDSKALLQPQGAGLIAPSAFAPPTPQAPAPIAPPIQKPLPAAVPQPATSVSPAPISSPTDQDYNQKASDILGNSQDSLRSELEKILEPTGGEMIGRAGESFADALSQAAGSHSNHEELYNQRVQQNKENQAGISGAVAGLGKSQYSLSQELEAKDPKSPLSKLSQKAYLADMVKAGIPSNDVQYMSSSLINDVLGKRIDLAHVDAEIQKAKSEAALAGATLGVRASEVSSNAANQKSQRKEEALKELADMPWYSRTMHPGISGALKQEAGLNSPNGPQKVNSQEEYDALPFGTHYVDSYGTEKVKIPGKRKVKR